MSLETVGVSYPGLIAAGRRELAQRARLRRGEGWREAVAAVEQRQLHGGAAGDVELQAGTSGVQGVELHEEAVTGAEELEREPIHLGREPCQRYRRALVHADVRDGRPRRLPQQQRA